MHLQHGGPHKDNLSQPPGSKSFRRGGKRDNLSFVFSLNPFFSFPIVRVFLPTSTKLSFAGSPLQIIFLVGARHIFL